MKIPFNRVYITGKEVEFFTQALYSRGHCGNHGFGKKCATFLEQKFGFTEVFLVPSGTDALEMGALLADLKKDDEVILPSWTFSSTANAIVLAGATPVFCEVDPKTMNIDASKIEKLITPRTKMIVPIDYAGVPCELREIRKIADKHNLTLMLDAAQSMTSTYGDDYWRLADLVTFSFHETKNFSCGEGGALCVNRRRYLPRAEFLQEKGTDRTQLMKGVISRYSWVDKGSSYLLSDLLAAVLYSQLESIDEITQKRKQIWDAYKKLLAPYEQRGLVRTPHVPQGATVNYHAFWVIFDNEANQMRFMNKLREVDVHSYIGYVPLHSSKMGVNFGYKEGDLPITEDCFRRLARLPFFTDLASDGLEVCLERMKNVLQQLYGSL